MLISLTDVFPQTGKRLRATGKIDIPAKYKLLLIQEMVHIDSAMQSLVSLIAKGETTKASKIALNIHNSFILKSKLSRNELKELKSFLPVGFIQMDKAFHKKAKKLSETLKVNKPNKSTKIYGEMLNACMNCHSKYAAERFPKLIKNNSNKNKSN